MRCDAFAVAQIFAQLILAEAFHSIDVDLFMFTSVHPVGAGDGTLEETFPFLPIPNPLKVVSIDGKTNASTVDVCLTRTGTVSRIARLINIYKFTTITA